MSIEKENHHHIISAVKPRNWDSSVSVVIRPNVENRGSVKQWNDTLLYSMASGPAVGPLNLLSSEM
jgi:hypothetical protein